MAHHRMKFIYAHQQYKDTMAHTEIYLRFGWDGDDDNGEDVEWLNLSSEIWYLHNIVKDFCGRWSPATKQWVSSSIVYSCKELAPYVKSLVANSHKNMKR
eukprot:2420958-Rhodomonas_salina.1